VRYEILGSRSVRVANGTGWVAPSGRKVEIVLAVLLIRANQVVSVEQLKDELWGGHPPRQATAALHVYICQLRKFLRSAGLSQPAIVTRSPGYVLRVEPDELDVTVFQQWVRRGRASVREGRYPDASVAFSSALALWRGPVLEELRDGAVVNDFVTVLEELRLECLEMLVDADLRLGQHRELVSLLRTLVAGHPLHEVFYEQLMVALCRSGRRADALNVYQRARTTLRDELGLEPGHSLRDLQRSILRIGDRVDTGRPDRHALAYSGHSPSSMATS
jgi:SARP family transcriptional regulator, regulator of embCAB operon